MRSYTLRSFILIIIFMNLAVITASLSHGFKAPLALWWSYFFVLLVLSLSYKKKATEKAFLNMMILLLVAIPIAGIGLPLILIIKTFNMTPARSILYMLISLLCILYLCIRHQRYTILEAVSKISNYLFELRSQKIRSSLASYFIFELLIFVGSFFCWAYFGS